MVNILEVINVVHNTNEMRDKNHVVISIVAGKKILKIQLPFIIKPANKLYLEGIYVSIINVICI